MLNVVLFGKTAKQWKDENSTAKGNMRDAATLNQLLEKSKRTNGIASTFGGTAAADAGNGKFN